MYLSSVRVMGWVPVPVVYALRRYRVLGFCMGIRLVGVQTTRNPMPDFSSQANRKRVVLRATCGINQQYLPHLKQHCATCLHSVRTACAVL